MSMPLSMMMKWLQSISWDAFNWSSAWYPSSQIEPYFTSSPEWYINTLWKTTLNFWSLSVLDDILIMVKQWQVVTQEIIWGIYYYTMPIDWILFYQTFWRTEMMSPFITKYLTDWIHTIWNTNVSWSSLISAWFNVKTFSWWISVSELNSLWYITWNVCRFKFYFFIWWSWLVNIDTFN